MSAWERIRTARKDMTDYVIHLTRFVVEHDNGTRDVRSGFARLKEIIRTGVILPTFAHRVTVMRNLNKTIRGPHPAACFTEQPLDQIPITLENSSAYEGYGVALHQVDLYNYGGRHAIYDSTMEGLSEEQQYRWVRYNPIKAGSPGYTCDFTVEREWRCRLANQEMMPWETKLDGIPLLLPDDFLKVARSVKRNRFELRDSRFPSLRIIVKQDNEVAKLREYIDDLEVKTANGYYPLYLAALRRTQIISLERVERQLALGDERYQRIEDLALPEKWLNIRPIPAKKTLAGKK